jgi:molybdenum cofactor synthesis domain-containing protein
VKKVKTTEAVGHVLCHDITQIIKGVKDGVLFSKGHIVKAEDIDLLLSVGKDHLYIYEKAENMLHENEAAQILYAAADGPGIGASAIHEGKIQMIAQTDGLLKIDVDRLFAINSLGQMLIATRHNNTLVKKGQVLAGTRIIPLVIEKEKMDRVSAIYNQRPIMEIKPLHHFTVGVVTTGNEVYFGRIKDTFTAVIAEKLAAFNLTIAQHVIVPDDVAEIAGAINQMRATGVDFVMCTGGMSVDPDDVTPTAIKESGAEILTYGTPVLPGAMMLIAYFADGTPVIGLPGCVMYAERTVFDLLLPRLLANDPISLREIAQLGHGGLCLKCPVCTFPHCEFGKGS